MSILIKNGTIINHDATIEADILIEGDKIAKIIERSGDGVNDINESVATTIIDASGKLIFPGLIDLHVHFRDPGFEYKDDIFTGSAAAVAGGVTTACPMANTNPVNDSASITKAMIEKSQKCGLIDLLPIAAITKSMKGGEITEMGDLSEAGAVAFSDDGLPVSSSDVMRAALEYSAFHKSFVINHSQDCSLCRSGHMNEGQMSTKLGIKGMPREQEEIMIARDMLLAKLTGGHIHIAHVSSAYSLELIKKAKDDGINITCEVTPHHFSFDDSYLENYDANYKMSPPLRLKSDVMAMREGLKNGVIDIIATDHAPHHIDEKELEFDKAAFGILGLQTLIPLTLNLVRDKIITLNDMARLCSFKPAQILGLDDKKGVIKEGFTADIAIIDANLKYIYDKSLNKSKSSNSPLLNKELMGACVKTIKSGRVVYDFPNVI